MLKKEKELKRKWTEYVRIGLDYAFYMFWCAYLGYLIGRGIKKLLDWIKND